MVTGLLIHMNQKEEGALKFGCSKRPLGFQPEGCSAHYKMGCEFEHVIRVPEQCEDEVGYFCNLKP
jgi:hypothetical protein